MPFPMKIQPINSDFPTNRDLSRVESSSKPVLKSRLKRLLDRPFTRSSNSDKLLISVDGVTGTEFEPSLAKMVQSYMEENNEKQTKNGRNHRCNCFNGNNNDISDDEFEFDYDHFKVKISNLSISISATI